MVFVILKVMESGEYDCRSCRKHVGKTQSTLEFVLIEKFLSSSQFLFVYI